jgi:hypothetical protein
MSSESEAETLQQPQSGGGGEELNLYIMTFSAEELLFFPGGNYPLSQNSYMALHISSSESSRFAVLFRMQMLFLMA